ncbi:MAG: LysR family transcriptional regulator [Minwuia sp.]|uniref:LysR family transcriptional regulator n=1 Tax=Minwuia sp. TaxID=2493630 RepID=UPI003A860245
MNERDMPDTPGGNPLRQLEIKHLMAFEAIYSTRNISRAGQSLGFSQPTMSNLLAHLRSVLNDPLFIRQPRGVQPSARADELIGRVRRALQEIEVIVRPDASFDPAKDVREFRLHMLDVFETILMPSLIRKVQDHTGVTFRLLVTAKVPIVDALESGQADLAMNVAPAHHPDLRWEELMPMDLQVIARRGHPAIRGSVTKAQLEQTGQVSMDMAPGALANGRFFRLVNRPERHDVVLVNRPSSIIEMVAQTDLVGYASRMHIEASPYRDRLQVLTPPVPVTAQNFQMTWHHRNDADPGLVWLKDMIRATLAERRAELAI